MNDFPGTPVDLDFLRVSSKSHGNLQAQEGLDSLQPDVLSKATEALKDFQRGGARHTSCRMATTAWVTFKSGIGGWGIHGIEILGMVHEETMLVNKPLSF